MTKKVNWSGLMFEQTLLDVRVTPTLGAQCTQGNYMSQIYFCYFTCIYIFGIVKKKIETLFKNTQLQRPPRLYQ